MRWERPGVRIRPAIVWVASGFLWGAAIAGALTGYDDEPGFGTFDRRIWILNLSAAIVTALAALIATLLARNVAERVDAFYTAISKTAMQIADEITGPHRAVATTPGDAPDDRPPLRLASGGGRHAQHETRGGRR